MGGPGLVGQSARHPVGSGWFYLDPCPANLASPPEHQRSVSVVRDARPSTMGAIWGHPAERPLLTRRVIHRWTADSALPEALSL